MHEAFGSARETVPCTRIPCFQYPMSLAHAAKCTMYAPVTNLRSYNLLALLLQCILAITLVVGVNRKPWRAAPTACRTPKPRTQHTLVTSR